MKVHQVSAGASRVGAGPGRPFRGSPIRLGADGTGLRPPLQARPSRSRATPSASPATWRPLNAGPARARPRAGHAVESARLRREGRSPRGVHRLPCSVPVSRTCLRRCPKTADDSSDPTRCKGVSIKACGLYKPTPLHRGGSTQIDSQGIDSGKYGGKQSPDPAAGGLRDEVLDLDNPVSVKSRSRATRPQGGHNERRKRHAHEHLDGRTDGPYPPP